MRDKLEKALAGVHLTPELKKALLDSFAVIAERQETLYGELRQSFASARNFEAERETFSARVFTALADDDQLDELARAWNFFRPEISPEAPADIYLRGMAFLSTDYESMAALCERHFRGRSASGTFDYELCPSFAYVNAERELDLLWQVYGFAASRPWSPWARRAVRIRLLTPAGDTMDLDLQGNGLEGIFLTGKTLVWNVETQQFEHASAHRIAPGEPDCRHVYHYTGNNEAVRLWPLPDDVRTGRMYPAQLLPNQSGNDITLTCSDAFASDGCRKFAFHENTPPPMLRLFTNQAAVQPRKYPPQSRAQFNRLLADFTQPGYVCGLARESGPVIRRYCEGHRGRRREKLLDGHTRDSCVDVKFETTDGGDPRFLIDYANWVLEELEYRLPFIAWRGVF